MYDLLLSRYSDIDFILHMNLQDGIDLYLKAIEKQKEEELYQAWLTLYPYFNLKTLPFVTFKQYKEDQTKIPIKNIVPKKSKQQLLREAEEIKSRIEGRGLK